MERYYLLSDSGLDGTSLSMNLRVLSYVQQKDVRTKRARALPSFGYRVSVTGYSGSLLCGQTLGPCFTVSSSQFHSE